MTPKEGPPTLRECEADDKAWADIVLQLNFDNYEEAQSIFLTRCAESAIEAILDLEKEQKEELAADEKRRAALEELYLAINTLPVPFSDLGEVHNALDKIDALTPTPEPKE